MISILNYTEYRHGGVCFIIAAESVPCPICGGKLYVHGTCRRKCITPDGIVTLGLRVMECRNCHRMVRTALAIDRLLIVAVFAGFVFHALNWTPGAR